MQYKLKQSSGPIEVWGTDVTKPERINFYLGKDQTATKPFDDALQQWHSSFSLICTVKPKHEEGFRGLANKNYTASTFIHDLSQGIIIPAELVGFEYETIATNLVGGTGTIKHAILIEPKEEGENEYELWIKTVEEIFILTGTEHTHFIAKEMMKKFTIKRR